MVAPAAAPRSQFNGVLTVGVVTVPVKLVTAVRPERVGFHLLHDQDHVRLKQTMVCPNHGEVHPEHRVKGYEVTPDNYVLVRDEDLEAARPAKSRDITVDCFVRPEQIDPRYFEKPYYLLPGEHGAKNYRVLLEAMRNTGLIAVARFVMRDKAYLAAVRPVGDVLALYTMRFAEELVDPVAEYGREAQVRAVKVDEREMRMALQLVESLSGPFEPDKYRNGFVRKVKELIEAKARGEEVELAEPVEHKATPSRSLADVLEASLKHPRRERGQVKTQDRTSATGCTEAPGRPCRELVVPMPTATDHLPGEVV